MALFGGLVSPQGPHDHGPSEHDESSSRPSRRAGFCLAREPMTSALQGWSLFASPSRHGEDTARGELELESGPRLLFHCDLVIIMGLSERSRYVLDVLDVWNSAWFMPAYACWCSWYKSCDLAGQVIAIPLGEDHEPAGHNANHLKGRLHPSDRGVRIHRVVSTKFSTTSGGSRFIVVSSRLISSRLGENLDTALTSPVTPHWLSSTRDTAYEEPSGLRPRANTLPSCSLTRARARSTTSSSTISPR